MNLDPPYHVLADLLIKGRLVPFLGAGASLREDSDETLSQSSSESLPSAKELADLLARELGIDANEIGAHSLLEVALYYELCAGRLYLQSKLRSIFLHAYRPGSLHRFLANLPNPILIVTTNYDRLLEQAFLAQDKPYHLVVTPIALPECEKKVLWWKHNDNRPTIISPDELDLSLKDTSIIFKIHGSVDPNSDEFDSFVVSEEDYFEMAGRYFQRTLVPPCIYGHLAKSHIVFLGYSLRDIHMRHVVRQMRLGLRHFAIAKSMSKFESYMWRALKIDAYEISIQEFIEALRVEGERLSTVYTPPQHPDGTVHKTKAEAEAAEHH